MNIGVWDFRFGGSAQGRRISVLLYFSRVSSIGRTIKEKKHDEGQRRMNRYRPHTLHFQLQQQLSLVLLFSTFFFFVRFVSFHYLSRSLIIPLEPTCSEGLPQVAVQPPRVRKRVRSSSAVPPRLEVTSGIKVCKYKQN
jgi:hypothetical protein